MQVARTSGLTHAQIATDFGISEHSVQRWLKQANIDDRVLEGHAQLVGMVEVLGADRPWVEVDAVPRSAT